MTPRRTVIGLILCLITLSLIMACAEPAPTPSPPPPRVEPPPPPPSGPPVYYVNVSSLALREGPASSAPQIGTLNFNDKVEVMNKADGWGRVRDSRRNLVGWAYMRYLQLSPASRPTPVYRRQAPGPKKEPEPRTPETPTAM